MIGVDGTYTYGKYEKICSNSLHAMSNVKLFPTQAGLMSTTHYIDPYDTPDMDQKWTGLWLCTLKFAQLYCSINCIGQSLQISSYILGHKIDICIL